MALFILTNMKLINQSINFITEQDPLKCIELAGKITHKSEIKDEKKFLIDMLRMGHTATLEFGSVYIKFIDIDELYNYYDIEDMLIRYNSSNMFRYIIGIKYNRIYTNLRWVLDNIPDLFSDLINDTLPCFITRFTPEPEDPYRRLTYHIVTNRGISHELVRHRVFSFMQESTRYCNYSKDKFGNELNIINPFNNFIEVSSFVKSQYISFLESDEHKYDILINRNHLKAQEARGILPNDLKTELYMCGFLKDWIGHNVETYAIDIFGQSVDVTTRLGFDTLRRDKAAHPQCREIAEMIFEDIINQIGSINFGQIKQIYYE